MKIFKYPLSLNPINEFQEITIHKNAKILCLQMQNKIPTMWAIVDEKEPLVMRQVFMAGTGYEISEGILLWTYLGTIQILDGALVFHYFIDSEDDFFVFTHVSLERSAS